MNWPWFLVWVPTVKSAVDTANSSDLVLRLTALLLVLHGATSVTMEVLLQICCGLLLVLPSLLRNQYLWWIAVAAQVVGNVSSWSSIDNHKYLITYWTAVCALSVTSSTAERTLAWSAKWLTAVVFVAATAWKVIEGQYVNGRFFYWTFHFDPRLERLTAFLAGTSVEDLRLRREAIQYVAETAHGPVAALRFAESSDLVWVTLVLSWLVLIVEAWVGVAHAMPVGRARFVRHVSLLLFILGTYALMPVLPFAYVLSVMGLAQCDNSERLLRVAYLAMLGYVQLTMIPWQRFLS